jgi:ABC-type multidrug transport system ATPase subunit
MIEINDLSFGYTREAVLVGLNMQLPRRGLFALCGANGIGKTTLLKLLGGILPSKCPSLKAFRSNHRAIYMDLDFLSLGYLRVEEFVAMISMLNRLPTRPVLSLVPGLAGRTIRDLSLGQQQRVMLAIALSTPCDVLLLDEPLNGLDCESRAEFEQCFASFGKRGTLLFATHQADGMSVDLNGIYSLEGSSEIAFQACPARSL